MEPEEDMTRHPADTIAEAGSFLKALSRFEQALRHEQALLEEGEDPDLNWEHYIANVREARRRYLAMLAELDGVRAEHQRRLVAEFRARGWEDLATALETGDWGRLAFQA